MFSGSDFLRPSLDRYHAAGTRAFSKMMSARIGDGFVHPVIGGWIWSNILAAEHPAVGREVTVLPMIADALDRARALGWRNRLR